MQPVMFYTGSGWRFCLVTGVGYKWIHLLDPASLNTYEVALDSDEHKKRIRSVTSGTADPKRVRRIIVQRLRVMGHQQTKLISQVLKHLRNKGFDEITIVKEQKDAGRSKPVTSVRRAA